MKNHNFLIITLILTLLIFSCGKDDEGSHIQNEPSTPFSISFFVVDSSGQPVFSENGSSLSQYQPSDFAVESEFPEPVFVSINSHPEHGQVFRFGLPFSVIFDNQALWENDSIIEFYPCFGDHCDTASVYRPFNLSSDTLEILYWNRDTFPDFYTRLISYELND